VQPIELESVNLGCVGLSRQCFDDGRVGVKRMAHARVLAQQALEPRRAAFLRCGWASTVGSSGSIRAVFEALKELDPAATTITPDGLEELFDLLCRMKRADDLPLRAVPAERRGVFPGGVAILAAVFSELKLKSMRWSEGAMREGLLYDMVGRYTDEDAREATVRSMQQRYHVDVAQAVRIEKTALQLFRQARERWRLRSADAAQMLSWAARLHEIGLDVAHSGYHRHGAYLLENADMPGFTREEQLLLARIVGGHRRKLALTGLADLAPPADAIALPLLLLLRLAVLLHRSRSETRLPRLTLGGSPRAPVLRVGLRSFRIHPLTGADLNDEVAQLAEQGIRLRVFPR
jgi:exopolyphosphatase / guanosine-5'-triphosphate,3'-diphosphate pyrophosphatase